MDGRYHMQVWICYQCAHKPATPQFLCSVLPSSSLRQTSCISTRLHGKTITHLGIQMCVQCPKAEPKYDDSHSPELQMLLHRNGQRELCLSSSGRYLQLSLYSTCVKSSEEIFKHE